MWELIDDFYPLEILILRVVHTKPLTICQLQFWLSHPCTGSCRGLSSWVSVLEVKKFLELERLQDLHRSEKLLLWQNMRVLASLSPHPALGNGSVHISLHRVAVQLYWRHQTVFICASNSRGHMSSSPKCSLTMSVLSQEQWFPNLICSTTSNKCLCYYKREKAWLLFLNPSGGLWKLIYTFFINCCSKHLYFSWNCGSTEKII